MGIRTRSLLSIFYLGCVLVATPCTADCKVAVFYASTSPVKNREKALKSQVPTDITVFARAGDFYSYIQHDPVSVVIAPNSFEFTPSEYEPKLQFKLNGKDTFSYEIVTTSKGLTPQRIPASTGGVVEEVGHQKMPSYLQTRIGIKLDKFKTVSKLEDLFPLLVFKLSDYIILPNSTYNDLKKIFTVETFTVPHESKQVQLPRVYLKKGEKCEEVIENIFKLTSENLKSLGFDSIERIVP